MTFTGTLLPYQTAAVDMMIERQKVLVSYDLGLGKTVITIAALEALMDAERIRKPGLVICLASLKYQWADAIHEFTGGVRQADGSWVGNTSVALVIDGKPAERYAQYEQSMLWHSTGIDYTILSYEQVVNDWSMVNGLPRGFIVCDEATAIKHFRSKRTRHVKQLKSPFKYALTGTPIENGKPEELYSLMEWVDPTVLGRFDLFDATFIKRDKWGGVERYRNLRTFNKVLMTACVRKGQDDPDVSPYLPAVRTMTPIRIPFDARGAKLYNRISDDLLADLAQADDFMKSFSLEANYGISDTNWAGAEEMALRGAIMSKLTCLRMLCDHPQLLRISAALFDTATLGTTAVGSYYASQLAAEGRLGGLRQTPKFVVATKYVREFLDADEANKVLLFSYFKATLSMLQAYLGECYIETALYTGDLSAKEKEAQKRRFQTDPNCRVLLSSDAGGYGVDLPQANLLVNYDLPWTPGTAKQRNGRIRRASSTFPFVVIQDMLMRGSIEERQWEALQVKDSVASAILDGKGVDARGSLTLTLASLASFLRESSVA